MTREKNTADQANICTTYLSWQTSERRDHFHHHRQCNEVQHIVQLELDRALVKLKKRSIETESSYCRCFKGGLISKQILTYISSSQNPRNYCPPTFANLYLSSPFDAKPTKTVHQVTEHRASINSRIWIHVEQNLPDQALKCKCST